MPKIEQQEEGFLYTEHNCSICEGAKVCKSICEAEVALIEALFCDNYEIEKVSSISEGKSQCSYKFTPKV